MKFKSFGVSPIRNLNEWMHLLKVRLKWKDCNKKKRWWKYSLVSKFQIVTTSTPTPWTVHLTWPWTARTTTCWELTIATSTCYETSSRCSSHRMHKCHFGRACNGTKCILIELQLTNPSNVFDFDWKHITWKFNNIFKHKILRCTCKLILIFKKK